MLDNFREWLSDNLRYILLGLAILIVLVILFFGIKAITGGFSDKEGKEPAQKQNKRKSLRKPENQKEILLIKIPEMLLQRMPTLK